MDDIELEIFDNMPFRGTAKEADEIIEIISGCIKEIRESNNIRYIVLETWFTIDYFILHAIGKAFRLSDFNTKDFDCKMEILPNNFNNRLRIFEKVLNVQRTLPENPYEYQIKLPVRFMRYMKKEDKDFYNKFIKLELKYYETFHPEIIEQKKKDKNPLRVLSETVQYKANKEWYETYKTIDKEWLDRARRINKVRNRAAHSYTPEEIYKELDGILKFNDKNAFEESKNYCLETIETLLGVKVV
ncbi:hypothetical protein [Lysinibacillus sphaericus]|uniref:hypothetical protein n=1 Tax=Lysinibacillus sphaericus TaxID=1421 RepID=UPI000B14B5F7|nr:hypothetical protein [Lysinibacillus sphaericus]QPA61326.1 hypothetical protein INQ55_23635 [Lysinibacillus sphaericus]